MDHETGRLGDHDDVVIFVPDVEDDRRVGFGRRIGYGLRKEFDHVPLVESVALGDGTPVDEHVVLFDQNLHL
jgi:hypothetical protein